MKTALFDYELPHNFIAQSPAERREDSRLMVLYRSSGKLEHRHFRNLADYLDAGDLLVVNSSRVIPARLHGYKSTGGKVQVLLIRRIDAIGAEWECLVKGRRVGPGTRISIGALKAADRRTGTEGEDEGDSRLPEGSQPPITGIVQLSMKDGRHLIKFSEPLMADLSSHGEIPLPPYIDKYHGDLERYQTVYGRSEGSVAAPTAGLHFSTEMLDELTARGITKKEITLHIGLDTFRPIRSDEIESHVIHSEWAEIDDEVASSINLTRYRGGRIVAVGTTTTRTLEFASARALAHRSSTVTTDIPSLVEPFAGDVDLYIRPGYDFRVVDALITNFHLPRSSLLVMVSAFVAQAHPNDIDAGRRMLLDAYEMAKLLGYRFYSFGDAMLIL